jgi:hypothetical protein
MRTPDRQILVEHDDGQWYRAGLLDQYRDRRTREWQVVVTYSAGPGMTYIRAEPADRCRPVDNPPHGWVDPRDAGQTSASRVTPAGTATRPDHRIL